MRLYRCPRTRASRAVSCLEELGEPYERMLIDIRDPEATKDPGFRAARLCQGDGHGGRLSAGPGTEASRR